MTTREQYPDFNEFEITPDCDDSYELWGHGEYEESSVLAGQYRRGLLDHGTLAELRAKYPDVDVSGVPALPSCMMPGVPDTLHGEH